MSDPFSSSSKSPLEHEVTGDAKIPGVFEAALDAIVVVNDECNIVSVNSAAERLFDYPRHELIDRPVIILIPERYTQTLSNQFAAVSTNGGSQVPCTAFELCGRRRDGTEFPAELRVSRFPIQRFMSVAVRDMTECRRVEQSLQRSEAMFKSLVQSVREYAIFLLDPAGRVASWNSGAERIHGFREDEIMGQHFSRLYQSDDIAQGKPQQALDRALAEPRYEHECWRVRKDNSQFWANVVITSLRGPDGELVGFTEVSRDMTRLNEQQELALQAETLATFGAMVSGLAHESRNALQQIQSSVEMLTRRVHDLVTANLVSEIQKAQDRLLRLFEDVRAFATPIRLNRHVHNIRTIWREAWQQLSPLRENRHAQLEEQTNNLDLHCLVDRHALERAFHNIFLNSLSACHDPAIIKVDCSESEQYVRVAICDNGPGLNLEQKERIFQPFYTTKTKSTGLGMAITKRIVEAHGGQIDVGLQSCCGTEIIITLPKGTI